MKPNFKLTAKYAAFCVLAMTLNLGAQYAADVWLAPPLWLSMGIGTAVGLLAKYTLDRNYIFNARGVGVAKDAQRFVLYTAMGVVTTLIFWGTEWTFAMACSEAWAKYLGGAIGMTVGYFVKYQLDRRWVFGPEPTPGAR